MIGFDPGVSLERELARKHLVQAFHGYADDHSSVATAEEGRARCTNLRACCEPGAIKAHVDAPSDSVKSGNLGKVHWVATPADMLMERYRSSQRTPFPGQQVVNVSHPCTAPVIKR